MNPFERILVPTDMSEFAELAMEYALLFRRELGSRVTLLYADEVRMPVEFLEYPLGYYIDNPPESKARIQQQLRDFAWSKAPEGGIETMVIDDSPARAIVKTARGMHANLIIMGTHGRSGWKRAILGSVTDAVLRNADVPVLTVAPSLQRPGEIAIRNVLAPVPLMNVAGEIAKPLGAELMVMAIADDDPPERLLDLAERRHADLIVIGSTKQHLTRRATCPVLTLPPSWYSVTTGLVARHGEEYRGSPTVTRGRM